ncbi:uncharacterized protein BCR38DRAFT_172269 [Pseudomassariella vexata]|uniref:Fucose-specific lectin n=1 Tax=Pseudomassariella vexata TaxID=1141098 RepID=A0A1Y2E3B6_9PEZI|nr:uncharacterized protein BCR38DRAFT_172269 [Pseudomassariella vexata]ORY66051.1 hypothetical protein BCR38DRAFT_172269 [Pseudomassariella vexata]
MNDYPLVVPNDTNIASYFPYVLSQDADDQLRWTTMLGQNGSHLSAPWWVNDTDLNAVGSTGTGMTLLPVRQQYLHSGGIIYRTTNGKLASKIRDSDMDVNADAAWTKGSLSTDIPEDSPIAAFTVGRPYNSDDQVNTYILYQDALGTVQVVWQDDDSGWKGPETYDAISNAEKGTDITCLTQAAWDARRVTVSKEQDMNQCFFQEKGTRRLKEVWFNGTDWNHVGYVPLD